MALDEADVRSRNATEEAILEAARELLREVRYERLTMDAIAKRAFVSRTALYFYFPGKRALVDRLIQLAFTQIREAAAPYLDGDGDPRRDLRSAFAGVIGTVNDNAHVLLLAARLAGVHSDHMPAEWAPYVYGLVDDVVRRIARDQQHGVAPLDIPPRLSAQALLAMVENHIVREVVLGGGEANRSVVLLAELWWRAVYAFPEDIVSRSASS